MKKIFTILLASVLILLTGCLPQDVDHEIRPKPTELEYQAMVEDLKLSTVTLIGYYMEFQFSLGSGMIFDKQPSKDGMYYYYVITNNHVVQSMTHVIVRTQQGNDEVGDIYAFPILETDKDDIAIIRFESAYDYPIIPILPYHDNQPIKLSIGQHVFAIGTPIQLDNFNLVSNLGIISDLNTFYISHTANINPGNSGGPLFSYDGTFIGINTQRVEVIDGETIYLVGDAIPANKAASIIRTRIKEVTPKLGIVIVPYDEFVAIDYEQDFGEKGEGFDPYDHLPKDAFGVVIIEVNSTRPSYGIIQRYDLIQKVNGIEVKNNTDIMHALGTIESGKIYQFEIVRFNEETDAFDTLKLEVAIPWKIY